MTAKQKFLKKKPGAKCIRWQGAYYVINGQTLRKGMAFAKGFSAASAWTNAAATLARKS